MTIGIDARMINSSGIGTYIRGLVVNYPEHIKKETVLFGNQSELRKYAYKYKMVSSVSKIYSINEQLKLPSLYKHHKIDLLHVPHYNVPCLYRGNLVVTIHDLIHLLFPQFLPNPMARIYAETMFRIAVRKAKIIIADSHNTKNDIIKYFKLSEKKICVVYPGIDAVFHAQVSEDNIDAVKLHYNLPKKYILYVGNIKLSKNIPRLVQSYRILKKRMGNEYGLVLTGKNFLAATYWEINKDEDIVVRENVSFEDLPAVYQGAQLFVFPSLYEGFGLPPLEAMASRVPVISSNAGSLPEILGDASIRVHPLDIIGSADAMEKLLNSRELSKSYIEKGLAQAVRYTWKDCADKIQSIYKELLI
ncbi:MAG: glycosyltransferase family 1 protein [bacterium]